eukprot:CAMPEP_0175986244 /NCGR_PEP_ID=MMETSP0108-20121206/50038_1 /TAXON_ID=195067 ORGANISM="Goniomonas pacifica, Strain CCMP1869" /NCGR_SAMPLE_ID=MMETSP0108 /ASSEMBLY_ACC=CAM_ASM_000204 /LENGTH=42 /DNA_ID= /DNA_START= /DNA_END= /DNA_ORIENTATION=
MLSSWVVLCGENLGRTVGGASEVPSTTDTGATSEPTSVCGDL